MFQMKHNRKILGFQVVRLPLLFILSLACWNIATSDVLLSGLPFITVVSSKCCSATLKGGVLRQIWNELGTYNTSYYEVPPRFLTNYLIRMYKPKQPVRGEVDVKAALHLSANKAKLDNLKQGLPGTLG
jgi:hypothetical protein